ncbi:DUF3796 domain-containing protein [Heliobacillus mobilis]|uniref:DUF3796 domain-containing protein n=1 Tax=Heliobacterium mobile TaxID=28064 RepID=A0A6I3SHB1_HELMO|nr:DUF3796 domain-containing protein [Heliobacterium mobile]
MKDKSKLGYLGFLGFLGFQDLCCVFFSDSMKDLSVFFFSFLLFFRYFWEED